MNIGKFKLIKSCRDQPAHHSHSFQEGTATALLDVYGAGNSNSKRNLLQVLMSYVFNKRVVQWEVISAAQHVANTLVQSVGKHAVAMTPRLRGQILAQC